MQPSVLPVLPFELRYAERRAISRDPRAQKQVADEQQFDGTVVQAIWQELSKYAKSLNERWMTAVEVETMLLAQGVTNPRLRGKICEVLDWDKTRRWHAVVICKQLEILLSDPERQDDFIVACFDRFDRPDPAKRQLDKQLLRSTELSPLEEAPATFRWIESIPPPPEAKQLLKSQTANPKLQKIMREYLGRLKALQDSQATFVLPDVVPSAAAAGGVGGGGAVRLKKRGKAPPHPTTMRAGATLRQLEPLKAMILMGAIGNEFMPYLTFDDFKVAFLNPRNSDWVATFLGIMFESVATFCTPPHGEPPLPPLPWMSRTLTAVPAAPFMADADVLLLTQLEQRGGPATDAVDKPATSRKRRGGEKDEQNKKKMASSSSRRKSSSSIRGEGADTGPPSSAASLLLAATSATGLAAASSSSRPSASASVAAAMAAGGAPTFLTSVGVPLPAIGAGDDASRASGRVVSFV